jgi:hypothetical protein
MTKTVVDDQGVAKNFAPVGSRVGYRHRTLTGYGPGADAKHKVVLIPGRLSSSPIAMALYDEDQESRLPELGIRR